MPTEFNNITALGQKALKEKKKNKSGGHKKKEKVEYCPGYYDANGIWNNGFPCPIWGAPERTYCCGFNQNRFCCEKEKQISAPPPEDPYNYLPLTIGLSASAGLILVLFLLWRFHRRCTINKNRKVPNTTNSSYSNCRHQGNMILANAASSSLYSERSSSRCSACQNESLRWQIGVTEINPSFPQEDPPPYTFPEEKLKELQDADSTFGSYAAPSFRSFMGSLAELQNDCILHTVPEILEPHTSAGLTDTTIDRQLAPFQRLNSFTNPDDIMVKQLRNLRVLSMPRDEKLDKYDSLHRKRPKKLNLEPEKHTSVDLIKDIPSMTCSPASSVNTSNIYSNFVQINAKNSKPLQKAMNPHEIVSVHPVSPSSSIGVPSLQAVLRQAESQTRLTKNHLLNAGRLNSMSDDDCVWEARSGSEKTYSDCEHDCEQSGPKHVKYSPKSKKVKHYKPVCTQEC